MGRRIKFIIIAFLSLLAIAGYLTWHHWEMFALKNDTFQISFTAALWEDLLLFLLLGVGILFYQRQHPEEENLGKRISYLYGGRNLRERALEHNIKELKKLAGYCERCEVTVAIHEFRKFNGEIDAYRVTVDREYHLINLFQDASADAPIDISIRFDEFDIPEFIVGEITHIDVTPQGRTKHSEIPGPIPITANKYESKIDIKISPNSRATFAIGYWMWVRLSESYRVSAVRFMERLTVDFVNHWTQPIRIMVNGAEGKEYTFAQSQKLRLTDETDVPVGKGFIYQWLPPIIDEKHQENVIVNH